MSNTNPVGWCFYFIIIIMSNIKNEQKRFHYYPQALIRNFTDNKDKIWGHEYNWKLGKFEKTTFNIKDLFMLNVNPPTEERNSISYKMHKLLEEIIAKEKLEEGLIELENMFEKETLVELTHEHPLVKSIIFQIIRSEGIEQSYLNRKHEESIFNFIESVAIYQIMAQMIIRRDILIGNGEIYEEFYNKIFDKSLYLKLIREFHPEFNFRECMSYELKIRMIQSIYFNNAKLNNVNFGKKTRYFLHQNEDFKIPLTSRPAGINNCLFSRMKEINREQYQEQKFSLTKHKYGYIQIAENKTILVYDEGSDVDFLVNEFASGLQEKYPEKKWDELMITAQQFFVLGDFFSNSQQSFEKFRFYGDKSNERLSKGMVGVLTQSDLNSKFEDLKFYGEEYLKVLLFEIINSHKIVSKDASLAELQELGVDTEGFEEYWNCKSLDELKNYFNFEDLRKEVINMVNEIYWEK